MAGMWRLYGQAVGSLRHPVRTIREFASGTLPVTHAASLRPYDTGVALRNGGVDLAAIFRLIYWVSILEAVLLLLGSLRTPPLDHASPAIVGVTIVLIPLLMALIYAVVLPIYWYWGAFSVRLGFRTVAPWMSWQQARELLFVSLLPNLALWAVALSLFLGGVGAVVEQSGETGSPFSPAVVVISAVNVLLGLFLFVQSIRLVRAFRALTIWRTLVGLVVSALVSLLPVFVPAMVLGVVGVLTHSG